MNKVVYGLILGGILGIFDGLTSWFTPEVRSQLLMIVVGSTIKGVIAGVLIGFFARKVHSLTLGILFGLAVGLLLAFFVLGVISSLSEAGFRPLGLVWICFQMAAIAVPSSSFKL